MRLVNARFTNEIRAFWDERATSIEDQATKPIKDHVEMGFSGENGDPNFDSLINKMNNIEYYPILFNFVYGEKEITENKIQKALAQFVRSIQSFDSKYDLGRAQVNNNEVDFPNFSSEENIGKSLFFTHPPLGGAGCARCHSGAEFTLITGCNNNGVIGVANDSTKIDLTNTKAPFVNPQGKMNGPFMYNGSLKTLMDVINHYDHLEEVPENTSLDFRLSGTMHKLELSDDKKNALVAFLITLTGSDIYTNEKWSDPFDENGNITINSNPNSTELLSNNFKFNLYPNPTKDIFNIELEKGIYQLDVRDLQGVKVKSTIIDGNFSVDLSSFTKGIYVINVTNLINKKSYSKRQIKN